MAMLFRSSQVKFTPCVFAAIISVLCAGTAANASTYVATIEQVGADVVATGSGSVNLTGLTFDMSGFGQNLVIIPNQAFLGLGVSLTGNATGYTGLSGPTSFGTGGTSPHYIPSGSPYTAIDGSGQGAPEIFVPDGYVSGAALGPSTSTFLGATFVSLGLISGTYTWTWGAAASTLNSSAVLNSFTVQIGPPVPFPGALPLFATGLVGLGLLGWRRKRRRYA
jgi:hypothetical protein